MAHDVLVIGAGPAGLSTALHSARLGLNVHLIEEHPVIGEPLHCGECLSQLAFDRFNLKPPADTISQAVQGVRTIFPDRTAPLLTEPGHVLDKPKFEQWLADQAQRAGAQVQTGVKAIRLEQQPDTSWTVTLSDGTQTHAKALVDATGVSSLLAQHQQLPPIPTIPGVQYLLEDIPNDGYLDFFLWPRQCGHGYFWSIPKENGRANVGVVTDKPGQAKKILDDFLLQQGWADNKKLKLFGGLIPCGGPRAQTHGPGWLLVGDAAGFTSPMFEGGTHLSLHSGRAAAQTLAHAFTHGGPTPANLQAYTQDCLAAFPPYAKILHGKNILYSLTEDELNTVAHCLPPELATLNWPKKAGVFWNLLTRRPDLLPRGVLDGLTSLGYSRAKSFGW